MSFKNKKRHLLRQLVRRVRARLRRGMMDRMIVLAVTGSAGKTTASHYLHRVLSAHHPCHSGIDFNDENAVIRSMLKASSDHSHYVQEVSGHLPGQLRRVLPLIRHRIGIVTSVGLDHYRAFRGREKVAEEKSNMVRMLPPDGVAVLNADDELVAAMAEVAPCRVITFGRHGNAELRASDIESQWPQRLAFTLHWQGESQRLETQLFGDLMLHSVLAAVAGGLAAGLSLQQCVAPLQGVEAICRRTSVHRTRTKQWFIDDTFKASYWTIQQAIERVDGARAPRKTLCFGSFSDTAGADSDKYRKTAKRALKIADRVVFCGIKAVYIPKMMKPELEGRLFAFEDIEEASRFLQADVVEDELIYLKSSGMEHLERLIMATEKEVKCWKQKCPLLIHCQNCDESGWK